MAGDRTLLLFALGVLGTGMLAVPVLAGSAAYAVAEAVGWRGSLNLRIEKGEGRGFYGVLAVATLGGWRCASRRWIPCGNCSIRP
ncbi:MAG: divalent metal cation transporter [Planctomycetia bacterium]